VNDVAVEITIGGGAEVILHIAGAFHVVRRGRVSLKLGQDRDMGLAHDIGEDVQTAAVRHAENDLLDAQLAAAFKNWLSPPSSPNRLVPVYFLCRKVSSPSASTNR